MLKGYISISRYLTIFFIVAMVPVAITAYFSISQSNTIEEQAIQQNRQNAKSEFLSMLSNVEKSTIKIARKLSVWDETIINFNDSTYYQYWKETRVHDTEVFDYAIDSVELYKADGVALVPGSTISERIIEKATVRSVVISKQDEPFLIYFNPLYFNSDVTSNRKPDGYIAISVNLKNAIESHGLLNLSKYRDIKWKLKEGEVIWLKDILSRVELSTYDSPEIEAFSKLVRRSFSQYIIYSIALLLSFSLLLVIFLGRPLQRMALHVQDMHDGQAAEIPENILSGVKIAELEQLRRAVNEYRNNFHAARNTLIEKNIELEILTNRDVLTGIFNRRAFESHLELALESSRKENTTHALCYMDLDQFKIVNDTCGHIAGDELLKQITSRLQFKLRKSDILARLGGDEFGVLLIGCSVKKAKEIAEELRETVKALRFVWEDKVFDVGVSIGLVAITKKMSNLAEVLKVADAACYMAKDLGRNRVQIYQPDDKILARRYGEMQWVTRITQALDENRFTLYCQPIVSLENSTIPPTHYELLIRMLDGQDNIIPPMAFLPAAERYNMMGAIDRWVIHEVCTLVKQNRLYFDNRELILSINLSGQSLGDPEFLDYVINQITQTDVRPEMFCFEVTETSAITHLISAKRFIDVLHSKGSSFALDDFGSGLSSFAYLKNLKVDCLKIDGHFVKNIVNDPIDRAMVESINQVGHLMGMRTVAEFVENDETISILRDIGVDYGQGYGIAKPFPFSSMFEEDSDDEVGRKGG